MTEEKLEQLKLELGKFGTVDKCQEGFGQLFIRITEGFEGKAVQITACLQLVFSSVKEAYSEVMTLQVRKGYFLLIMRQMAESEPLKKMQHSRPYVKTEKDGQKAVKLWRKI